MKRIFLFIGFISIVFSGCAGPTISKTAFRDHYVNIEWYSLMKEKMEKNTHWGNCFDISEEELKTDINAIYLECIERELQPLPASISTSTENMFQRSIDKCAILKFLSKNKDKFTFDKSPQYLKQCKKIREQISTLK